MVLDKNQGITYLGEVHLFVRVLTNHLLHGTTQGRPGIQTTPFNGTAAGN